MMNLLITNDDGIEAPGLESLVAALPGYVNAVVVAPASEKSATSHSISLKNQLKISQYSKQGRMYYSVHGTPVDCVKFAVAEIPSFVPDLVISGINMGANTGVSVYYSGTIAAAREAAINGFPAIAVSLCSAISRDFTASIAITNRLIELFYQKKIAQKRFLLSVNVPPIPWAEIQGVRVTKQADSRFVEEFVFEGEDKNTKFFSLAGEIKLSDPDGKSDEEAVAEKFISITPFKLDLTDYDAMDSFSEILNGASEEEKKDS